MMDEQPTDSMSGGKYARMAWVSSFDPWLRLVLSGRVWLQREHTYAERVNLRSSVRPHHLFLGCVIAFSIPVLHNSYIL